LAAALRLALALDGGVLPIQGPPDSGKTYTGARVITAMANAGLRVGVTANSHKVIRNLLDGVRQASDELGLDLPCTQKISEATPDEPGLRFATENARAEAGRRDHLFDLDGRRPLAAHGLRRAAGRQAARPGAPRSRAGLIGPMPLR
jgi:hypothetical protein